MTVLRRSVLLALLATCCIAQAAQDPWPAATEDGAIVLVRHATAPGVGDPPNFRLGDCATQRNLSEEGRAEARALGDRMRARGVRVTAVWMSQWCRTRETARLAFGDGLPHPEPAFNSFFGQSEAGREAQTAKARGLLARWRGPGTLVVVTHQVNIAALTGVNTASAQAVLVRGEPGGTLRVIGSLEP
jgi:phosphohistidine phosphatase SixA